ncbi:MAG: DUF2157 domain-containing protein [Helicobacteraceae bacterium]|jgi:uncharacterized membrane protein|nr:DUF2157 domain-containing protein [Helicobacteraceae bacterium]
MKTPIGWLENEIKSWVSESLLSESSAEKILARYQNEEPRRDLATIVFAAFGAALIALGIISLAAYNWEFFSRGAKAALAILLLLIAQALGVYAKLKKPQNAAYSEGAGLFIALAFTGALAVIAQTYHLGGTLVDFSKIVIALTLPVVYIFNSKSANAILFIAIVSLLCVVIEDKQPQALAWIYFFAWTPWYVYRLIKRRDSHTTQAFNLLFMCGSIAILNAALWRYYYNFEQGVVYHALFFGFFWLISSLLYPHKTGFFRRPVEEVAKLAIAIMLFTASAESVHHWTYYVRQDMHTIFYLLCMPYFALFGFFFLKLKDRFFELIVPLAPFAFYLVYAADIGSASIWLFSLACLIGGAAFIVGGVKRFDLTLAYQGITWLALLVILRFFDSDLGFIEKGIGFIVVGAAFLASSIFIRRYIKDAK